MYSFLHSIFYRIVIKLKKIKKKASWSKVPIQEKTTFFSDEFMLYEPHLAGASTFANQIQDIETTKEVLKTLDLLSPGEPSLEFVKDFYRKGIENFGDSWKYADISSAVYVFSKMLSVENYLEVGVRRGRSMTVFASQSKNANIFGFDKWIKNYAGSENPGESLVREELNKVGFEGSLKIIDGDSKKTIPSFFKENPEVSICANTDILSLVKIQEPNSLGIDICFGTAQRLGIPMYYGGPHPAFLASQKKYLRLIPYAWEMIIFRMKNNKVFNNLNSLLKKNFLK